MEPRIEFLSLKKLVGKQLKMSLSRDRTRELFQSFMPRRLEIKNSLSSDLFCVQVFDPSLSFKDFRKETEFEKWAAKEVHDFNEVPSEMEGLVVEAGLYAVFLYQGKSSEFEATFEYIFNNWIPNSIYEVDNRPHFDLMGVKYKHEDPSSEEEIWVPIRLKQ
jgi:AraC family transcriptional regulator